MGFHDIVSNEVLHDLLKTHYALEESVVAVKKETKEDGRALGILQCTTKRLGNRFETGLLWKNDEVSFPDSYPMAVKRLKQLEQKLERNPAISENVHKQIVEYQQKGYAHLATPGELSGTDPCKAWYLPLNVALNPRKPGKIRLVWDAAAKVEGMSLNSQLLEGPDMLTPLVSVIIGFRERRIAFGADIREMYHQLRIIEADKQAQRFLFRANKTDPPSVYVMDVATFGSTCSPCSAQYVKNLNATEHADKYPEAAAAIINQHYLTTISTALRPLKKRFVERKKCGSSTHREGSSSEIGSRIRLKFFGIWERRKLLTRSTSAGTRKPATSEFWV
ncbi:uncharacterized protein LOC129775759 [Toxorhynchites rutilus septentrionalis]|uniref:uncharacterized protein LOC129775759 n=1 Tax=Toxorhynchites rutilus septentrionalis TaxID=329112 RepID=UPI002478A17C|nr:uncharacterized protein LOC129775759 [Toxorhynchites rutilus septentrionalis]